MLDVVLHPGLELPLATGTAMGVLLVGLVVVAIVAYDAYQQRST